MRNDELERGGDDDTEVGGTGDDGSVGLEANLMPNNLRKDLSQQRNYLGIIKIFDFLGKIIGQ